MIFRSSWPILQTPKVVEAAICPRSLLKNIRRQAAEQNYNAFFSQEFEWFNLVDNIEELYAGKFRDLKPMTPGMFGYSMQRASQKNEFFNDLFDLLKKFGVPLEEATYRNRPGCLLRPRSPMQISWRLLIGRCFLNPVVKQIAHSHGLIATLWQIQREPAGLQWPCTPELYGRQTKAKIYSTTRTHRPG
jgi:glutamine synthetase